MDMTTRLAAGRLSEIVGESALKIDREMRRKGMVYGAENSTKAMESDSNSYYILNAYRDGINAWIHALRYTNFPLEYKLMSFEPEEWTNLKTGLMLKFMADKLSGHTEDFEMTLAKKLFNSDFDLLYPERLNEEFPVTQGDGKIQAFQTDSSSTKNGIQLPVLKSISGQKEAYENGIGSNNWALSGSKTASGKPILCNDPHLPLNLPSIWYENQIVTPTMNVYGVSLPGAPQVVIGFNDSIAWGFTNGYRDVKDFYTIQFKDDSKKEYLLNGRYVPSTLQIETIKIKGQSDFHDTVARTKMGIVMYDHSFSREGFEQQNFAVKWMAHRGSNELNALIGLNRARNYNDYVRAIQSFECPHQNIVFASANGDIAIWSQGLFVQKIAGQGRFIEDGTKLENDWGDLIPGLENPHELNPARGFVMSANQINTDRKYPYYYHGIFYEERAKRLTDLLSEEKKYTVRDMMNIQTDTYWQNASEILPLLMSHLEKTGLNKIESGLLDELQSWDFYTEPESKTPVLYDLWFRKLEEAIYNDEFGAYLSMLNYPKERVTLQLLKTNPDFHFFDNIHTPEKESLNTIIQTSFMSMCANYDTIKENLWYTYKHTTAEHLSKIPAFSVPGIKIGGGAGIVNAASSHSGPSWRMIVHFTDPIEAYGVYPGGESGNPGSPYYFSMLDDWANGKYYRLIFAHSPTDIP